MFTLQYTNDDGGRAVAMAMLPPPPSKPITLLWQRGFRGGRKKRSTLSHVLKWEEWVTGRSGLRLWLLLMISSQGCRWFFKKNNRIKKQYITWTRTTQCPTVQTHTLTECKTNHTVSRWHRTVYIPWLVASYDTHKGKRWLNSEPPKPQATGGWPYHLYALTPTTCKSAYGVFPV